MDEMTNEFDDLVNNSETGPEIIENDDGSATVMGMDDPEQPAHDVNLATVLSENELTSIANDLLELIELDKESRKKADELYEEGLKRTGLSDEAPGGATFVGASKAVHPMLAEACVDYSSSAIKELFPSDGPVKIHNFSEDTRPDEIERAENKRDYLNWELVDVIKEYRSELEVLLTQQPLSGCQYIKVWWDGSKKRTCTEFVPSDLVIRPYASTNFQNSDRFALIVPLTRVDYERRVKSGFYRDANLESDPFIPDETNAQKANNKIEGKESPCYNEDGLRNFYEVYVNYEVEGDEPKPYIVTIDEYSRKVVAIYRNWDENDELMQAEQWVVDFEFIPWRGAGGIGLTHLIGSLSASATGALRALLDSAHLNNFPGAVRLKGARASGQNVTIGPTEVVELEAPAGVDDIRKVIMPLPFNQPSPVLFQLLGWLTDTAKGVVSTAEEKIADASNNMPVGTTLALIEQGSKVASAIHMRLHESQKRVLAIIQRLDFKYYDEQKQIKKFGRVLVAREDFMDTGNVVPVSDPNMFSESQRFAQIQGVQQLTASMPQLPWNHLAIAKRTLRLMHVQSPQEFLQEPQQPVSGEPTEEIVAAMSGAQISAKPEMNHLQHITEELQYLLDPVFGAANQSLINPGFQTILADVSQHLLFAFQQLRMQSQQMAQQQIVQSVALRVQNQVPPEYVQPVVMQLLQSPQAQTAQIQMAEEIYQQSKQPFMQLVQMQQQADQLVKTKTPPPVDPQSQTALQIAQMQEETKKQIANLRAQHDQQNLELKARHEAAKLELEEVIKTQLEPNLKQAQFENERLKNNDDNLQHQRTELIKNHEDNLTNLEIARVREQGETDRKANELYQQAVIDIMKPETGKEGDNVQM